MPRTDPISDTMWTVPAFDVMSEADEMAWQRVRAASAPFTPFLFAAPTAEGYTDRRALVDAQIRRAVHTALAGHPLRDDAATATGLTTRLDAALAEDHAVLLNTAQQERLAQARTAAAPKKPVPFDTTDLDDSRALERHFTAEHPDEASNGWCEDWQMRDEHERAHDLDFVHGRPTHFHDALPWSIPVGAREWATQAKTAEAHPPYYIRERDGKYVVVDGVGEVRGTFDTEGEARQQQKALYANVPGAAEKAKEMHGRTPSAVSDVGRKAIRLDDDDRKCAVCRKPATHFAHEPGWRASGVFLCSDHADRDRARTVEDLRQAIRTSSVDHTAATCAECGAGIHRRPDGSWIHKLTEGASGVPHAARPAGAQSKAQAVTTASSDPVTANHTPVVIHSHVFASPSATDPLPNTPWWLSIQAAAAPPKVDGAPADARSDSGGKRVDTLRRIVHDHQAEQVDGMVVDAQTANMLVTVHDALHPDNQAVFDRIPLKRLVDFAHEQTRTSAGADRGAAKMRVHAVRIKGFTYDADVHCPDCAVAAHGDEVFHGSPRDSEGNVVHPVFSTDGDDFWLDHCADCHRPLFDHDESEHDREF